MSLSRSFTHLTDKSALKTDPYHVYYVNSTTVYLLQPPKSHPSSRSRPWIITRKLMKNQSAFILYHPLTSKPYSFNFHPYNLHFSQLNPTPLAVFYAFKSHYPVDKLLVLHNYALFALYGGGQLQGCPRFNSDSSSWVELSSRNVNFDDVISFEDKVYVVDRQGITKLVNYYKTIRKISIGKTVVSHPLISGSGRFGWRKRFAIDGETLYLVVRMAEKLFDVFRLKSRGKGFYWDRVDQFKGNKVLFMARDCYFFLRASRKFPGREYRNCIVFSEAAFPQYGNDCWEFTESDNVRRNEVDIAVFRLDDERFVREGEGENSGFPKIDWSPPDWIFNVSVFSADEFQKHSVSESSSSQSEREPDEDERLDSATTKFEGLDIRSDLVPTLQKIWRNHGNIINDSIVRNGDIVARALESLATIVQILEDNPVQSLSDSQADYLSFTLSDLRNICFKVYWLVSFVEKALKVHKSKPLVESLNNLSQLSSQVKERRAILLGELANLDEEENKLKEEMTKVSEMIPFFGEVKFDEAIGAGLTGVC
ncbi:uncharacterized protein LOC141612770 [Silene latifolia]|uniref:uncharacterized protein LOC141612770 n=1 Tax=Silene latifolia TaxID=37657 RepID=UPI003D7741FF